MMNFVFGFVVLLVLVITSGKLGQHHRGPVYRQRPKLCRRPAEGDTILKVDGQVLPHHR